MRAIQRGTSTLFDGFLVGTSGLFMAFLSFEITTRADTFFAKLQVKLPRPHLATAF
jgi:hypothetical protein